MANILMKIFTIIAFQPEYILIAEWPFKLKILKNLNIFYIGLTTPFDSVAVIFITTQGRFIKHIKRICHFYRYQYQLIV